MSSDQWGVGEAGTLQIVKVRLLLEDGSTTYTDCMTRVNAEKSLASGEWLMCPLWRGLHVLAASIVPWSQA